MLDHLQNTWPFCHCWNTDRLKTALVYADYADVWFNYFWLDYWIQKSSHFATFRMLSVHLHWLYNGSTLSYTDRVITIVSPISTCCLSSRNELITHRHCQAVVTLKWNQQNSVLSLTLLSPTLYFYSRWQCLIVFTKQLLHNSYMEKNF